MKTLITVLTLILMTSIYAEDNTEKKPNKTYKFDNVLIEGYLDNPTPIYITDGDEGQNIIIELDRSFEESLKQNTDKERISRIDN